MTEVMRTAIMIVLIVELGILLWVSLDLSLPLENRVRRYLATLRRIFRRTPKTHPVNTFYAADPPPVRPPPPPREEFNRVIYNTVYDNVVQGMSYGIMASGSFANIGPGQQIERPFDPVRRPLHMPNLGTGHIVLRSLDNNGETNTVINGTVTECVIKEEFDRRDVRIELIAVDIAIGVIPESTPGVIKLKPTPDTTWINSLQEEASLFHEEHCTPDACHIRCPTRFVNNFVKKYRAAKTTASSYSLPCPTFIKSSTRTCPGTKSLAVYGVCFEPHVYCLGCGHCIYPNCTNFVAHDGG